MKKTPEHLVPVKNLLLSVSTSQTMYERAKSKSEYLFARAEIHGVQIQAQGSGTFDLDGTERVLCTYADAKAEAEKLKKNWLQVQGKAQALISHLSDPLERTVLTLRYIDGNPWLTVSRKMGAKLSVVYSAHDRALESLAKIYKKKRDFL